MKHYIDVWLKFDSDDDEYATYEANTWLTDIGYAVDWYHTDVGVVSTKDFDTLADAYDWLVSEGFLDFSS